MEADTLATVLSTAFPGRERRAIPDPAVLSRLS
jgi:hypothetical protein